MSEGPVLAVGGTGWLGGQVVGALQSRGKAVRALVRPASDGSGLEARGAKVVRGDLMDPGSLDRALDGVDAVVTTAAGYTRHRKGDTAEIDVVGNRNLADAAARAGVRRFVLTSILTCDQTPHVPHFWNKKLMEDRLEEQGVPFVALRPGAFLDQLARFGGDPFEKGRLSWFGASGVPMTFVLTADVAAFLAAAVDVDVAPGARIDIGWDRPVSLRDIAAISSRLLGRPIGVRSIPGGVISAAGRLLGGVMPMARDMNAMTEWFGSGRYVADTTRQREVFGTVPTAEDAITRFLTALGHPIQV
ncbi:SDR family oxidoreductase [Sinomonas sp. G460-2]|uniref:SDR family oxidoreductase n=1 Tax=Sinomonas sp. G460-2 TaxID=3393464 RepID=UPI0039F03036